MNSHARAKACFVIVYFGTWPQWIDYFLLSCGRNPEIHWLIFTDCGSPGTLPPNVLVKDFSKSQLEDLVSLKLGIDYKFSYGYKVCDMKPAYGHFFSEHLEAYSFWGYTDLDVVYGDIGSFLGPRIFTDYDVITASERILVGHFTLFRNDARTRLLYQECPDYLEKFGGEHCQAFDEKEFSAHVKAEAQSGRFRLYDRITHTEDCLIWWSGRSRFLIVWWNGQLMDFFIRRRLCYYHFIQSKYQQGFRSAPADECRRFYLDAGGLRPLAGLVGCGRFILAAGVTLVWTLPYYFKMLAKRLLPGGFRMLLRHQISRKR